MIAALFVDARGPYPSIAGVDCWPAERDARCYAGLAPVVAHPPCQRWTNLSCLNFKRYGGEHNRPGNDGGCFANALDSVRRFGGVLEHPADSRAWPAYGLIAPLGLGWQRTIDGGYVCEVWQSAYGHRARKRTWLYYFGSKPPLAARWDRLPGTHQIGWDYARGRDCNRPSIGKAEANRTPIEFAHYLIELAKGAA